MEPSNRYVGIDLFVPANVHKHVNSLVARGDKEQRPFRRQVDLWWAGMCIGLHLDERTANYDQMSKFHTGVIFGSDPWRITHLDLIGIALGGVEVLDRPVEVINQIQEYANYGMEWVADSVIGEGEPTLTLTYKLEAMLAASDPR